MGCATGMVLAVEPDESFVVKASDQKLKVKHLKTVNTGRQEDMRRGWALGATSLVTADSGQQSWRKEGSRLQSSTRRVKDFGPF